MRRPILEEKKNGASHVPLADDSYLRAPNNGLKVADLDLGWNRMFGSDMREARVRSSSNVTGAFSELAIIPPLLRSPTILDVALVPRPPVAEIRFDTSAAVNCLQRSHSLGG